MGCAGRAASSSSPKQCPACSCSATRLRAEMSCVQTVAEKYNRGCRWQGNSLFGIKGAMVTTGPKSLPDWCGIQGGTQSTAGRRIAFLKLALHLQPVATQRMVPPSTSARKGSSEPFPVVVGIPGAQVRYCGEGSPTFRNWVRLTSSSRNCSYKGVLHKCGSRTGRSARCWKKTAGCTTIISSKLQSAK